MPANHFDLTDRVAVVTGGSRGLGREMVLAFAEHGADVVIASRKLDNCEALAAEVDERFGRRALAVECHVGHWEQVDRLADAAYDEFGRVDILVNNAGMSPLYDSLASVTEALYDKVMDVNLKGVFRLSVVIGERMKADGRGSIVNVSSVAAVRPTPGEVVYAMAKAGVNNLTSSLAKALGPEVRVNCLMPGPFLTDIAQAWDLEAFAETARRTMPLERGGRPHEIVGAALYLASDASSFTTGSVLKVDGGLA
jgi:NAD(P)-dependent dehydrogenase (short-subunit alcohol dehydrogenase family)|tara:strand:- start:1855 stop:2613 length:759 start_codon:yes stop_codon:yes gene_type:complete